MAAVKDATAAATHLTRRRACRPRQGGAGRGAAFQPRRLRAGGAPPRSDRAARAPGADARARARADPLRAHAGLAVHVLPRRGADHGERPGGDAALGAHGAVLRRRAPVELRRVRLARAAAVFDVNDFDETLPGPWEWDVKRLAASMLIAARDNGYPAKDQDQVVLDTVESYRTAMAGFAAMNNLDVWYAHLDIESTLKELGPQLKSTAGQANREGARQGAHQGQHVGVLETDADGRRRAAHRRRTAADRADRMTLPRAPNARKCSRACRSWCAPIAQRWSTTGACCSRSST